MVAKVFYCDRKLLAAGWRENIGATARWRLGSFKLRRPARLPHGAAARRQNVAKDSKWFSLPSGVGGGG
jgi:hypothetical protein